jgi:hypothetical protein
MRYVSAVLFSCLLASCGEATEPTPTAPSEVDTFQRIVGEFCVAETTTVTRDGNDATVSYKRNQEEDRTVADANGFLRVQTVRSCKSTTCVISGGSGWTDSYIKCVCQYGVQTCGTPAV